MKIEAVDYAAFRNSAWELFKQNALLLCGAFVLWQIFTIIIDAVKNALLGTLIQPDSLQTSSAPSSFAEMVSSLDPQFFGIFALALISLIATVLFNSLFHFGFAYLVSEYVKTKAASVANLFHGFKDVRHWLYFLGVTLFMTIAIYGILFLGALGAVLAFGLLGEVSAGLGLAVACLVAAVFLYIVIYLSINWVFATLAAIIDKKPPMDALRYSKYLVQNNRREVLRILMQCFGWIIVGLLCFGVGLIVAVPFVMILMTKYYIAFRDHDVATMQ